ncbi:MAG: hypothetical protein SCARUB_01976 [Candidatus Scalindua rubra]|uniref:Uncharacterized protein n=1 Tax=Candidatus Scalindua rubra TaxID=1872076 RepID=A0A1E3XB93_9BACT|nr:MAG: hypothetical protein SCARUB_01976 [Candidatus Scalindua rubra]
MAYKIMKKDKVNKESETVETARGKGVNSTDLLGNFLSYCSSGWRFNILWFLLCFLFTFIFTSLFLYRDIIVDFVRR